MTSALAVFGLAACGGGSDVDDLVEYTLVLDAGPPPTRAVRIDPPWREGPFVLYEHELDLAALTQWYDDLPARIGCDEVSMSDDLRPPRGKDWPWALVFCTVERGEASYMVTAQTLTAPELTHTRVWVTRHDQP